MSTCNRPGWDEYFLEIAQVISKRSTCLRRRYGAIIVKDRVIVSTGFNGSAREKQIVLIQDMYSPEIKRA